MSNISAYLLMPLLAVVAIPFMKEKAKAIVTYLELLLVAGLSSAIAISAIAGGAEEYVFGGSAVTGLIRLQIDALSAWFILIINIVFITGGFYGIFYLKAYREQQKQISLHCIAFIVLHLSLVSLCVIQNSLVFLITWELMALSAFIAVIFEGDKMSTLKAGINYLIQSHVSILFLMLGFIWVAVKTGSFDFASITEYSQSNPTSVGLFLFICFFIGFAFKAGFIPFHTWLPHAHPAAPTHISGIMSGVLIKIGVYGIMRMLVLIKTDYTSIGYFILIISAISGLYGVMLAIIQHNVKKLLAYHSIENIGIIGMGIGIGCIGLGNGNQLVAWLGFSGALLHTLNHALFKSLLFYTVGIVYQATHTLNIEHLGGLIKKMPHTTLLFLIAAVAICGIPPLNGFVSEFLIYSSLYQWVQNATLVPLIVIIFSTLALVLIGGLALFCFTKAFGTIFLGEPRKKFVHGIHEAPAIQRIPLYFIALLIVGIGIFPQGFFGVVSHATSVLTGNRVGEFAPIQGSIADTLQYIGLASTGFIVLIVLMFLLRKLVTKNRVTTSSVTWGCGYVSPTPKLQYTASSYVRSYSKLFGHLLLIGQKEKPVSGIFPEHAALKTHPYDRLEKSLIDRPIRGIKSFLGKFVFLNNGKLQFSILYGIIFIISLIMIPLVYGLILDFFEFIKQL
ncbi:MAG TPA: proton-conducting transporter membrane subunit [Prolixibacteraceae bacterium]|nr:proton-conducting transporter membrane subunit [Prolixibacteraceae bacterium]